MKEYDYTIVKSNTGEKPFTEFRDGYYQRQYTIYEIQDLYHNCGAILKKEGYFKNGEEE